MTQLNYLCYTKFHEFRDCCSKIYLNDNLGNSIEEKINSFPSININAFLELVAIILVGRGDFSNFNDSLNNVSSVFKNEIDDTLPIKLFLLLALKKSWSPNSPSNVSLTTLFNDLVEGMNKLQGIKFKP